MVAQSVHLQSRLESLKIGIKNNRWRVLLVHTSTMSALSACHQLTHLRISSLGTASGNFRYTSLVEMVPHLPPTLHHFSERADEADHYSMLGAPLDNHRTLIDAFAARLGSTLTELKVTAYFNGAALRLLAAALPRLVTLFVGTVCDFDSGDSDAKKSVNTTDRNKHEICASMASPWFPTLTSLATHRCTHETEIAGQGDARRSTRHFMVRLVTEMPRLKVLALGPICSTDLSPLSRLEALHTLSLQLCGGLPMTRHSTKKYRRRLLAKIDTIVSSVGMHLKTLASLDLMGTTEMYTGATEMYKGAISNPGVGLRPLSHLPPTRHHKRADTHVSPPVAHTASSPLLYHTLSASHDQGRRFRC
jgi:hypothetical protein